MRRSVNQLDSARKKTSAEAHPHDAVLLVKCQPAMTSLFFRLLMPILVFIIMLSFFTFHFPCLFLSTSAFEFSTGKFEKSSLRSASTSPLASPTSPPSEASAPISFLANIHLAGTSHPTFGGFLEPIDQNGSSLFKLGSTIPVKFMLKWPDGQQQSAGIKAQIFTAKVSDRVMSSGVGKINQTTDDAAGSIASRGQRVGGPPLPSPAASPDALAVSAGTTDKPTPGNNFLRDSLTDEFVFNLGTKDLTPGTWQIEIVLDDGRSQTANVSLVK